MATRDVCFAKDAGFIQFDGLPESIKKGCPAMPAFKSRYCTQHVNQACDLLSSKEVDDELDVPTGSKIRGGKDKLYPGNPVADITTRK